jgi:aminoglycoside phosphotransferase (APT) family kinase protein
MIRPRVGYSAIMDDIRLRELKRIGEGREAEVFALEERRVLRLARAPELAAAFDQEHAALEAARRGGAPVPAVYGRVEVEGRPGLVVERLGTGNLLLEIGARPWSVVPISRALGTLHARVHEVVAPGSLPSVHERARAALESPLVPTDVHDRALAFLDDLPYGDRLCHGDFNPANVLRGPGGEPFVIDWTAASRGDPAADVARSRLIIGHGAVGPDATAMVAALARVGRGVLWNGYRRAYARQRPVELDAVDSWFTVMAAARLGEGIAEERESMLRLARR